MGLIQLLLGVGAVLLLLKLGDIKALSQGKIVFADLQGHYGIQDRDNIALAFAPFIVRSSWVRVMRHDQDPGKAGHRDAQKSYKSDS
ncbi:predicted protein [Coccidioides posadasii str. Silveira]|uniref:Predicted protein n=1 Tax=Coccidioides posadasii (strain RMSCC 757 / Silveira) TaxID=443226 RepID=E9DC37_COCPS|nr:predicted protein [Coccidioides posadasii str. Silveira]